MTGRVKGPEYDAECRSLIHQYEMSAQTIAGFDPFKFAQVSNPLLPIRVSGVQLDTVSGSATESQGEED